MSPFFRRKNSKRQDESAPAEAAASESATPDLGTTPEAEPATAEPAAPAPAPSSRREELLDAAYRAWHAELTERASQADKANVSSQNGVVDLSHPHPTGSALLFSGSAVRISSLIRESFAQQRALANVARLRATHNRMAERYGHAPVSLAVGQLTWTQLPEARDGELKGADDAEMTPQFQMDAQEAAGGEPADGEAVTGAEAVAGAEAEATAGTEAVPGAEAAAPEPVRLAREMHEPAFFRAVDITFEDSGDAQIRELANTEINPVVLRALRDAGASAKEISQLRQAANEVERADDLLEIVNAVGASYLPGFSSQRQMLLGCFARPEGILLSDLEAMEPYIRTSGIMMALAGDEETRKLSAAPLPPGLEEDRAPEGERGVGDLDVEELNAVEAVASGRSIVLNCPPGSKQLETIASISADAAASGRSLLVIPDGMSSGAQIKSELERLGLGELVLDFSDVESVPRRIRTGLRLPRGEMDEARTLRVRERLVEVRRQLASFVDELHRKDPDWHLSVHDLLDRLASLSALPTPPKTRVRLGQDAVAAMSEDGFDVVAQRFEKAGELGAFDATVVGSAWAGANVTQAAEGAKALDSARRLHEITVPAAIAQSSRSAGETGMTPPKNLDEWFEQIDVLDGIADSLDTFKPQIFETSPLNLAIATAPKEWRASHGHTMKRSERRRYRKQAMDLVRPGEVVDDLHEKLLKVQQRREVWRRYNSDGGWPVLPDGLTEIRSTRTELAKDVAELGRHLPGVNLAQLDFSELQRLLAGLVADADQMNTLPERNALLGSLRGHGFGSFLDDVTSRAVPKESIRDELELAFTSAVFEQLIRKSPTLAALSPRDLMSLLTDFRELDKEHTQALTGPVMRAVVNNARAEMQKRREETLRLDQMLAKGSAALRDAIATYSRLVQVARPVWIVPPSVLAEFIPPMPWADLVLVEAGSDLAGIISPMMRGRQAVVVGDLMRPGSTAMEEFAKVLPVVSLPTTQARHDLLSASALHEIGYDVPLVPEVSRGRESRFVFVDGRGVPGFGGDGAVESTPVEVEAVVDAVLEHAIAHPDRSLAVIALNATHATRIREALAEADSSDVQAMEDFVVTDLTRAASLRRQHVILAVGYGKTVHGRVLHTFGSLATPIGLAGLIDAIAAASQEFTVISALAPGDIDLRRVSTPGPRLLAKLIDGAGGAGLGQPLHGEPTDPLVADLASRLNARGWDVAADYGYDASPKIPLVAGKDGEFTVAVLVDNERYVAEKSLRRRDRYWVDSLKSRGWDVFQTFSSSIFIDPNGQVGAIEDLLRARYAEVTPVQVPTLEGEDWGTVLNDDLADDHAASSVMPVVRERGPRPKVTAGLNLAAYSDDQLDDMLAWIASDGVPRSADELRDALRDELGLTHRGMQVDAILGNVVRRSGLADGTTPPRESRRPADTGTLDLGDPNLEL